MTQGSIGEKVTSLFSRIRFLLGPAVLTTNATLGALFGFSFWIIAAKVFSSAELGVGASQVALMSIIGLLGRGGADTLLLKNSEEPNFRGTAMRAFILAVGGPLLVSLVLWAILAPLQAMGYLPVGYVSRLGIVIPGSVALSLLSTFDGYFLSLGRYRHMTVQATLWGVGRLGALGAVSLLGVGNLAVAWLVGSWLPVIFSLMVSVRSLVTTRPEDSGDPARWNSAVGMHLGTVAMAAPFLLFTPLTEVLISQAAAGTLQIAISMVLLMTAFSRSVGLSALRETLESRSLSAHLKSRGPLLSLVLFLGLAGYLLLGRPVLSFFGPEYVQAYPLLLLFAAAAIPTTLAHVSLAYNRRVGNIWSSSASAAVAASLSIGLGLGAALYLDLMLTGLGVGHILGQTLGAAVLLVLARRSEERAPPVEAQPTTIDLQEG